MEPIAIIGMGCRLPGECTSPSKLWDLLEAGQSAHSRVPASRFNIDSWYHPEAHRRGFAHATGGYFLSHDESHLQFDPSFFGISPVEAQLIDPQQRKLLEVVYETFESAGTTLEKISGSQTACYIGCFTSDYRTMQQWTFEDCAPYTMTGSDMTIISNRINYVFNLKGPSLTVDTACSSSLYALHLACQSLLSGDCEAAIVGGTNLILSLEQHLGTVSLGVLSPTSKCHTFDEKADGFGRADGITAIYIKRLSDAVAHGDPIRGVIRSTAVNTNGKSSGINHPEAAGQEAVIRKAYARAGLDFNDTGFFECHGTGTPVGDPIEASAIGSVFANGRDANNPLLLGSVKTNLGHTEGASGIASVLKCVLSLENAMIPANAEFERINPRIDLKNGCLSVVRQTVPWPLYHSYRRASINSFGYGGANAHIIIDAAASYFDAIGFELRQRIKYSPHDTPDSTSKYLLVFTAHNVETLKKSSNHILRNLNDYRLLDIAYTLSAHRSRLPHRCFAITDGSELTKECVEAVETHTNLIGKKPVIAFVFTGQGAQWPRMGYELVNRFNTVRETFGHLQSVLDRLPCAPDWTILDELSKAADTSKVYDVELSQPLGTAVQIALVDLFRTWNITPAAVTAHSSGEVAAAYSAGAITAAEAIVIAYCRGIAVARRSLPGAMLAVGIGANEVAKYICNHNGVVIGCHNSPQSVTLSGEETVIDELTEVFRADKVFARKVNSSGNGYHSPLVKDAACYLAKEFGALLPQRSITESRDMIPIYSSVTAGPLLFRDFGIDHWLRNLTDSVLFNQSLQTLITTEHKIDLLIEIGPHSALSGPIRQLLSVMGLRGQQVSYHASLLRGKDDVESLLALAGHLFIHGYPINLENVNSVVYHDKTLPGIIKHDAGKFLVDLPTYQWSYGPTSWTESRSSRAVRFRKHASHDLLGSLEVTSSLKSSTPSWHNFLRLTNVPWIADHKIGHEILFPAAGYTAMVIEALRQIGEERGQNIDKINISKLAISSPLIVPIEGHIETMANFQACPTATSSSFSFVITSVSSEGKCTEHARGFAFYNSASHRIADEKLYINGNGDVSVTQRRWKKRTSDKRWYERLTKMGLHYGPAFQPLLNIRGGLNNNGAMAEALLHKSDKESRYLIHPTLLDGCLQLSFISTMIGRHFDSNKAYLPVEFTNLQINHSKRRDNDHLTIHANATIRGFRDAIGSFKVLDSDSSILAEAEVVFKSTEGSFGTVQEFGQIEPYSRLVWEKVKDENIVPGEKQTKQNNQESISTQYLIYYTIAHPLLCATNDAMKRAGFPVSSFRLVDVFQNVPKSANVIVFVEMEKPLLTQSMPFEFEAIQFIFRTASSIIWVTQSGILSGGVPHTSMMMGMAKTIRTEQPALKLYTIDFDPSDKDYTLSAGILVSQVMKWSSVAEPFVDLELAVRKNTVHVSRFITDEEENSSYAMRNSATTAQKALENLCTLNFQNTGNIETFYYFKTNKEKEELHPHEVLIIPYIWPLSKSDVMILRGRQPSGSLLYECLGKVSEVGASVTSVSPGSNVLCLLDRQFETSMTVNEAVCVRTHSDELNSLDDLGSIMPYCIAINALKILSRAIEKETLLLLGLSTAVTQACIRIGQAQGLKILVACNDEEANQLLHNDQDAKTFTQIDPTLVEQQLERLTSGVGIDIVIGTSADFRLPRIWNHLARNGRLILIGTGRNVDFTSWDLASAFSRGATMSSFNLAEMIQSQPQQLGSLMRDAVKMLRDKDLHYRQKSVTFDISRLPEAANYAMSGPKTERVLVTMSSNSIIPTLNKPFPLKFPSTASYILVGCLGGLGRSLTMWMAASGARNFVFLSRSGADKPFAASMLEELKASLDQDGLPWSVQIIRGDVTSYHDVQKAISAAPTLIKGVIQATMVLESYPFAQMPYSSWTAVLDPKVRGTENLHNALQHVDLDFFVMTSSAIGVLGIPTQGAYAAANAFLDAMARYRWARGLQACSLALGMVSGVGHVAENSDIQYRLQRYGSYPIPESEFLSALEVACTRKPIPEDLFPSNSSAVWGSDVLARAHLITGLDLSRAAKYLVLGSPAAHWLNDIRLQTLKTEFEARNTSSLRADAVSNETNNAAAAAATAATETHLQTLHRTLATHGISAAKQHLITQLTLHFSKLTGVEAAKLESEEGLRKPLMEWGVDSLVGAELKRWIWRVWRVEVEVLGAVEEGIGVGGLGERIWTELDLRGGMGVEEGR